jgi:hypothetical protein
MGRGKFRLLNIVEFKKMFKFLVLQHANHFWPFLAFFAIFEKKKDVTLCTFKAISARAYYVNPSDIQDATRGFLQKMLI